LIVAFIIPPHQPVIQVFEAYANMYFFAALAWAWVSVYIYSTNEKLTLKSCLGIFIAHQARDPIDQSKVAAAQQRL